MEEEDYETGLQYHLDVYSRWTTKAVLPKDVPFFAGLQVFEANGVVNKKLREAGALLKEQALSHEYPHCWRCKNPVIFRSTEQWFISMEKTGLRKNALKAIKEVSWIPNWGQDRIYGLIENRPDWCVSARERGEFPSRCSFVKNANTLFSRRRSWTTSSVLLNNPAPTSGSPNLWRN